MSSLPGSGGPAENQQVPEPPPPDDQAGRESDQGETEDEEIKMNCIGGQCGMHDSDFSSDGGVDADSDEGEERDTSRYEKNFWVFESKTCCLIWICVFILFIFSHFGCRHVYRHQGRWRRRFR